MTEILLPLPSLLTILTLPPKRDRIGEFLQLLDTTAGKDKFFRLLQFGAKFVQWQETQLRKHNNLNEDSNVQKRLQFYRALAGNMCQTRRVLRLFRALVVLRALKVTLSTSTAPKQILLVHTLSKLCLATYFLLDNVQWARSVNLLTSKSENCRKKVERATDWAWFGEITLSIVEQLLRMCKAIDSPNGAVVKQDALTVIVRNAADLGIVSLQLNLFNWADKANVHLDGIVGILGVVGSLISLKNMWPVIEIVKVKL